MCWAFGDDGCVLQSKVACQSRVNSAYGAARGGMRVEEGEGRRACLQLGISAE